MIKDDISRVRGLSDAVEGMLSNREGRFLYEAARKCTGRGAIVEIGSFNGKSTVWLARGSQAGARVPVFCIDPFEESAEYPRPAGSASIFDAFNRNIRRAGVESLVTAFRGTSAERAATWDKPIELLWIDGDHSYAGVKLDFEKFGAHLLDGGLIAFHDTLWTDGPRRVVRESIFGSRQFRQIGITGAITYARKTPRGSLAGIMRAAYARASSNACNIAVGMRLPAPLRKLGKKVAGMR
jgi:predicted O-methyltransferase YrrM